jgi:hypothetical protein
MADFEEVLDHAQIGLAPSKHYKTSLSMLDSVVRESMFVSKSWGNIPSPSAKHFYASVLFTTLISRAVSLINLAPHSEWSQKVIEHWDYASAAVVTRTMLEIRLAFYYLCIDVCDEMEWNCRWDIFNLHDCTSRRRLFDAMEDHEQVQQFTKQAEELKQRLEENPFFMQLPQGEKKRYLNGQQAYMAPLEDIAEKAGLEKKLFRSQYVLLSSHVHGLPMSFYRISPGNPDRGRGLPSPVEEGYTGMCLSLAAALLAATKEEVEDLFASVPTCPIEQTDEPATLETHDVIEKTSYLEVGDSVELIETEILQIIATRINEDLFEVTYLHKPTSSAVLIRHESETEGAVLYDIDPMFWTVRVNGRPVPEEILLEAAPGNYAFRVNHVSFEIDFKFPQGSIAN